VKISKYSFIKGFQDKEKIANPSDIMVPVVEMTPVNLSENNTLPLSLSWLKCERLALAQKTVWQCNWHQLMSVFENLLPSSPYFHTHPHILPSRAFNQKH